MVLIYQILRDDVTSAAKEENLKYAVFADSPSGLLSKLAYIHRQCMCFVPAFHCRFNAVALCVSGKYRAGLCETLGRKTAKEI